MHYDARVGEAISLLYDAAVQARHWPQALDAIRGVASAAAAAIFQPRQADGSLPVLGCSGVYSEETLAPYLSHYHRDTVNPRCEIYAALPAPKPLLLRFDLHFDDRFAQRDAFHSEFLRPLDLRHTMAISAGEDGGMSRRLVIERSRDQGPFTDADATCLSAIIPHLRNAVRLQRTLAPCRTETRFVLEQMAEGVLVADQAGRVQWMNRAAEDIVSANDGLAVHNNKVQAARSFETTHLQALVRDATRERGAGGAMAIGRPSGRGPYGVLVSPLDSDMVSGRGAAGRHAIVLIKDPARYARNLMDRVGMAFGLSPAERRLTACLLEGRSLQETSQKLDRRMPTLRTQLKSVLLKTGTRGQADLIRVLLSFPTVRPPRDADIDMDAAVPALQGAHSTASA